VRNDFVTHFDPDKKFEVRDEVIAHTRKLGERGKEVAGRILKELL